MLVRGIDITYSAMYKGNATRVTSECADRLRLRFIECASVPHQNEAIIRTTDDQRVRIVDKTNSIDIVVVSFHLTVKDHRSFSMPVLL